MLASAKNVGWKVWLCGRSELAGWFGTKVGDWPVKPSQRLSLDDGKVTVLVKSKRYAATSNMRAEEAQ